MEINKIFEDTRDNYLKIMMKVAVAKPTQRLKTILKNTDDLAFMDYFLDDVIFGYMQPEFKKNNAQLRAGYDDIPMSMTIESYRSLIQTKIIFFITENTADVEDYILNYIDNNYEKLSNGKN